MLLTIIIIIRDRIFGRCLWLYQARRIGIRDSGKLICLGTLQQQRSAHGEGFGNEAIRCV
ncbi:hypothetical protein [Nostoc sp.]